MPEAPPPFYLTPFGWRDPAEIRAQLAAAGFGEVAIETVRRDAVSRSAHDLASGLVRGNPVVQSIVEAGRDPETIVAAVAADLAREGGERPWRSTIQALVVTAR